MNEDGPDGKVQFREWVQHENEFMNKIVLSDEASFKLNVAVPRQDCVYWPRDNPHILMGKAVNFPGLSV
jgi:hypothetical protein